MNEYLNELEKKLENTINHLEEKLLKIIASGAHPSLLNGVMVKYYDSMTPINQISSIKANNATMLIVTPFDKTINKNIVEAISKANLGFNPIDEGESIRIMVPSLTMEKREIFAKNSKTIGEEAKISVRTIRQDFNKKIKLDLSMSENEKKLNEQEIQKLIDKFNKKIDEIIKVKIEKLLNI